MRKGPGLSFGANGAGTKDTLEELLERLGRGRTPALRDEDRAARAERLAALVRSEVWRLDLRPLLETWANAAIQGMSHPPADTIQRAEAAGYYKVCEHLINFIAGEIELGRKAFRRIIESRLGDDALRPGRRR